MPLFDFLAYNQPEFTQILLLYMHFIQCVKTDSRIIQNKCVSHIKIQNKTRNDFSELAVDVVPPL